MHPRPTEMAERIMVIKKYLARSRQCLLMIASTARAARGTKQTNPLFFFMVGTILKSSSRAVKCERSEAKERQKERKKAHYENSTAEYC